MEEGEKDSKGGRLERRGEKAGGMEQEMKENKEEDKV